MTGRRSEIGFSQRIRLEWFERTADMILAGNDEAVIDDSLQDLLRDKVSVGGTAVRSNRGKIITILLKTWVTVPREREKLRDEGLVMLQRLPRKDGIAVHWGMVAGSLSLLGRGRRLHRQALAASGNGSGGAGSATDQGAIRRTRNRITSRPARDAIIH